MFSFRPLWARSIPLVPLTIHCVVCFLDFVMTIFALLYYLLAFIGFDEVKTLSFFLSFFFFFFANYTFSSMLFDFFFLNPK